jgi:hypothetical protein
MMWSKATLASLLICVPLIMAMTCKECSETPTDPLNYYPAPEGIPINWVSGHGTVEVYGWGEDEWWTDFEPDFRKVGDEIGLQIEDTGGGRRAASQYMAGLQVVRITRNLDPDYDPNVDVLWCSGDEGFYTMLVARAEMGM